MATQTQKQIQDTFFFFFFYFALLNIAPYRAQAHKQITPGKKHSYIMEVVEMICGFYYIFT